MGTSSSAGGRLALALFLTLTLAACGSPSDTKAITALVDRLMAILTEADGAPRIEDLDGIFTGLDEAATTSITTRLAPFSADLSYTIQKVKFIPFGGASVTVAIGSEGTTSTLELKAMKAAGEWRLGPLFHIKQRIDEVKAPGS